MVPGMERRFDWKEHIEYSINERLERESLPYTLLLAYPAKEKIEPQA